MTGDPQLAVWLYGSHARGDSDADSDLDLFVASDEPFLLPVIETESWLQNERASISRYSWSEVEGMAGYGSLFLQHLHLEGRLLYEGSQVQGRLGTILSKMGDYRLAQRDIRGFQAVVKDVERSLEIEGCEIFETSVIATVIRHASILGCWLLGRPSFSRTEPVARLVSLAGLSTAISDGFQDLYRFRLYIDGRLDSGALPTMPLSKKWIGLAKEVVTCVEELNHVHS